MKRGYREKYRRRVLEYSRKYREKNKSKLAERAARYRKENPEKFRKRDIEYNLKRRGKKGIWERKRTEELADCYVKLCLKEQGFTNEEILKHPVLIKIKREQIKFKRLNIKTRNNSYGIK